MATHVFPINNYNLYCKAGATDLIEMLPTPGDHPLYLPKYLLETLVESLMNADYIHLSGPTGVAKTSLIDTLHSVPENLEIICHSLGISFKPLKVFSIEAATYETPGEWFVKRSLVAGNTVDQDSDLVKALLQADSLRKDYTPYIHLREIGRVHSASVQGGLLNLISKQQIVLSGDRIIKGQGIGYIADSNYQAMYDAVHTLVTFDDALKRRFDVNISLSYLDEEIILTRIVRHITRNEPDRELISKIVTLGNLIRSQKTEGNLQSLPPATIQGYVSLYRKAIKLKHYDFKVHALSTLMGNASMDDQKLSNILLNQILGYKGIEDTESVIHDTLF